MSVRAEATYLNLMYTSLTQATSHNITFTDGAQKKTFTRWKVGPMGYSLGKVQ